MKEVSLNMKLTTIYMTQDTFKKFVAMLQENFKNMMQ